MRAWRLTRPGGDLSWRQVPDPSDRPGSVLVRITASPLLSYFGAYVRGELTTLHPPRDEFTPGPMRWA